MGPGASASVILGLGGLRLRCLRFSKFQARRGWVFEAFGGVGCYAFFRGLRRA